MLNIGSYRAFGATAPKYSARARKLVERSLVIDMLSPLKLDFTPAAYEHPISWMTAQGRFPIVDPPGGSGGKMATLPSSTCETLRVFRSQESFEFL